MDGPVGSAEDDFGEGDEVLEFLFRASPFVVYRTRRGLWVRMGEGHGIGLTWGQVSRMIGAEWERTE